jgi:hypothetical protein
LQGDFLVIFRYGVLLATATAVLLFGLLNPDRNWDMIAYVAASYYQEGYRGSDLTRQTYGEIKREVSDKRFAKLIAGEYRNTVFHDPAALEQQLPFYTIRVGYLELIRLFKKFGLSYAKSTYVISAIFASLSVLVLGLIILRTSAPIAVLPVIVAVTEYTELAGLSTPDAMACFFSLLGIYSLLTKRRLVFFVAAALPLIRTDFILLSGLLMIYTYFNVNRFFSLLSILLSVAFYILINKLKGNYGYLTIFNFSFISEPIPYPADMVISHKVSDYLRPYILLIGDFISHSYAVIYVLSLYLFWLKAAEIKRDLDFYCLFALPFIFIIAHLLLYPSVEYRFLVFAASLICVWSLGIIRQLTSKSAL